jgi:ABC-type bacteriocin/lantibiotic exporter with double-glycine peptidase domain
MGPSGQGKSTLLRILSGVLEPTSGRVLLDGVDIREYSPESLAGHIGSLVGDPLVMADSVRNNLLLRCPDASDRALQRAVQASCFQEVVARLPNGYQTQLEAHGTNLSGGERQRLGLAQALLREPQMLFMDEATCSLDAETESRVLENLLRGGATLVSVAHRAAVIETAARVYEVSAGQVRPRPDAPARARCSRGHLSLVAPDSEQQSSNRKEEGPCRLQLAR